MERKNLVFVTLIATLLLSGVAFGGVVLGTEDTDFGGDVSGDFICSNEGAFTDLIGTFLTILVFGAPVAGAIVWFADRSANSFGGDNSGINFWVFNSGDDALKAGIAAPIGLYAFQFILSVAFGINIGCLTP